MKNRAFTLVELLVVVLIIGILAAIAVPQYQYAVLKARYHTLMDITRTVKESQERYFLQNGEYAEHFSQLDISAPGGAVIETVEIAASNGSPFYTEGMTINNGQIIVALTNEQTFGLLYINNERAMDYNLRMDNREMWGGARAICVSWASAGKLGQKLCNDITNAPESCSLNNIGRYSCRIYQ